MFNQLTIKARLMLLAGVLFTFMALIGMGGIYGLYNAEKSMETVYNDRLVPMGQLDRYIRLINRGQQILSTAVIKGEENFGEAMNEIAEAKDEAGKVWKEYQATSMTDKEAVLVSEVNAATKEFVGGALGPAVAAMKERDMATLTTIVKGPMHTTYVPVRKSMNALIKLQMDIGEQEYLESEKRYKRFMILAIGSLGLGLLLGLFLAIHLIRSVTKPIEHAVRLAEAVAAGDLTQEVEITSKDEMARLLTALKDMQSKLTEIVSEVRVGTETMNVAAAEISAGNTDLSSRTEEQAASLEETASSMEELTSTVKQNADNARQANQLANSASEKAVQGGSVIAEMTTTMAQIRESSDKIVDIISVIDGIAFQTNILALNASVEAARAGDQGRGFAVVASEVRNLAQRSATAAKEIKSLIGTASEKVSRGTTLMDQTGSTIREVVVAVQQVADIINDISAASREQSDGIDQINIAINQIDETTQQNAALVEEAAAAAQSMEQQAANLQRTVGVFQLPGHARTVAAQPKHSPVRTHTTAARKPQLGWAAAA